MTPALRPGDRVRVEALAGGDGSAPPEIRVGDIVLVISEDERDLLLHRVVHLFQEGGQRFLVHQGDAGQSTFAVCPWELVLGKAVGFAPQDAERPWPTLDALDRRARQIFRRRAAGAALFCRARLVARRIGVGQGPLARGLARIYRAIARALSG